MTDNAEHIHKHINETLHDVGIDVRVKSEEIIDVVSGYKGKGPTVFTDEEFS